MPPLQRIAAFLLLLGLAACNAASSSSSVVPSGARSTTHQLAPNNHHHIRLANHGRSRSLKDISGALVDGGFESGGFTSGWTQCGNGNAVIDSTNPHSGLYDALVGNIAANPGEESGMDGVCQQITVPTGGQVTLWVDEGTSETSTYNADQEADLLDSSGNTLATLFSENGNTGGYQQRVYDVSAYAGQTVTLFVGIYGSGSATDYNFIYVDDVSLAGSVSASPTPAPTLAPTAGPTATPAVTPTPGTIGAPTPIPTPLNGGGNSGSTCGTSCGVQRWHIKTLDDAYVNTINWTPTNDTVTDLTNQPVPAGYAEYNDTTRYAPVETTSYTVQAILQGWKIEADHDFHLVLADPNDPNVTMIAEIPDPNCSDACDGGFSSDFGAMRAKLTNCFGQAPTSFTNFPSGLVVNITGIGFFDVIHGQTGVAPNGIELHPVLNIDWVSGQPNGC